MKYQILIEILYMLLARKKVSAKAIADRYDISIRTAYRYLTEIELADVPLIVDRGSSGGYSIAETFKLPASFFTKQEFSRLISIIEAFEKQLGEDYGAIKDKLLCATRRDESLNLKTSNLIIDGSDWFSSESHKEKLIVLTKAIDEQNLLEISYHDRGGDVTKRIIEPHALALKQGLWYVYAFCHLRNEFRLFKIGRIEYATAVGSFERREFNSDKLPFNDWKQSVERTEFVFEIDKTIKSDVEEWLGIERVHELKDGKIVAGAALPYDKGLVYQILKFGSHLKVLTPDKLKNEIVEAAKNLIDLYSTK